MKNPNKSKFIVGLAAMAMTALAGCAPPYVMTSSGIYGDHFVRKLLKPAGSVDEQQLTHYYVEICDVGDNGKAQDCNITLVMENMTNYTWK